MQAEGRFERARPVADHRAARAQTEMAPGRRAPVADERDSEADGEGPRPLTTLVADGSRADDEVLRLRASRVADE